MIRGGKVDIAILGALQVGANGDLANWAVPGALVKGMGGATDLVAGTKRIVIFTDHVAKDGTPKIVEHCTLPLTGVEVVDPIITDRAILDVNDEGGTPCACPRRDSRRGRRTDGRFDPQRGCRLSLGGEHVPRVWQNRNCLSDPLPTTASRNGSSTSAVDGPQFVEAVGESAAGQCAEDGRLGLVGEPGEVLSGVVGDQALPGPF
jgi:hypothetical protein